MEQEDNLLDELLREIAGLLNEYPKVIERRAATIHTEGKDPELAQKLFKAADTMRDSGNLYLTWAKHFAALADGSTDAHRMRTRPRTLTSKKSFLFALRFCYNAAFHKCPIIPR